MRNIFTVMKFTMRDMLKRKSFIISTLIMLVLIIVGFNIPNIINSISDNPSMEHILLVDKDNIFEGNLSLLNNFELNYDIEIADDTFNQIKEKIENGEIDSAIIIEKENNNIKIRYIVENTSIMSTVPEDLTSSLNALYSNIQIQKLGLTEEQLQLISPNFELVLEQTSNEEASGDVFVIMLISIVLFYAIYFCAYQVSSSITTEKTSKIIETLVTSTSPRNIVLGKTLGIGLVGLMQLILIVTTAYISAKVFIDQELLNSVLDMSNITIFLGVITIIYFILGYFTYALLYALTGSTVSKPEDVQQANTPIAFLSLISFYLSYFTMMNPTSNLNLFASLFPLSSPFCMPFRVMMGLDNPLYLVLSLVILIITILVIAKVTIKIYSSAILNYGTRLSFKDIINIYKDKKN